ncbi:hypothetical protein Taro_020422 [Colocasia esculenta]|uniref:Pectinesterase inhibitor domain-containing protein n=1 Tax=Colocasia esculenta TaxID=4460 RepID=A0A843UYR0_COLES|nr:hypothetical protein [Colocasia esculenta]
MVAAVLLVSLLGLSAATRPEPAAGQRSVEFIRSSCGTTQYPHLCFETLSGYAATIQTSSMQLAHAALSVSLDGARSTSAAMGKLMAGATGMRPREAAAMRDCVENMEDSVEELLRSLKEMGKLGARGRGDIAFQISSIQTWVSAALTEEGTCMDGFAGSSMAGSVKTAVRGQIVNVAQLTSNALALINALPGPILCAIMFMWNPPFGSKSLSGLCVVMAGHLGVCSPSCFGRLVKMVAAVLLVSLLGLSAATRPEPAAGQRSVEFIRSSCGTTQYPRLCFETLSGYAATIQTSSMQLAHAALSVSLDGARSTSAAVGKLMAGATGMRPREAAAMRDCVENMEDSVEELLRSLKEMGKLGARGRGDIAFQISSIQTWVSAALTEEGTCMDGFAGSSMAGSVKTAVRGQIVNVAQLTSNALALINALVSTTP